MRCHVDPLEVEVDGSELDAAQTIVLAVGGMGCPNCAARVRNELLGTAGVLQAEVVHESAVARVWCAPGRVTMDELCRAVDRAAAGTHHEYRALPLTPRFE